MHNKMNYAGALSGNTRCYQSKSQKEKENLHC